MFLKPFFPSLLFFFVFNICSLNLVFSIEIPRYQGPVLDLAQFFSKKEKQSLVEDLVYFQKTHGPSIQVFTLPSLEGENIEDYSIRVAEKWKIGNQEKDDGVLLLIALKERRIRIEVGQGLEGQLPDLLAGRIIQEKITPFFKNSLYKKGIVSGLKAIAQALGGELKVRNSNFNSGKNLKSKDTRVLFFIFLLFLILFIISGFINPNQSNSLPMTLLLVLLAGFTDRRGGGGFSGGFGGGRGGFGGGFGGGFSGGGASGGW